MKHIFKKLHIGGSHESSRSSESPTSIPATCASDHERAVFSQNSSPTSANHPSASSSPVGVPAAGCDGAATPGGYTAAQPDYLSSEEDFQMQMALAISASSSNSEDVDYPEKEQIRAATRLSLGQNKIDLPTSEVDTAEALSRQYWDYNVLDYEERIVDGFYDVFGLWMDSPNLGKMPSLIDLESKNGNSRFEVVIINRTIDNHLEELVQVAHCMAMGFNDTDIEILVQRLAELVTENMGGPVEDANVMLARWMERSTELRKYLHTSVLPIGSVSVGLSRHRALLFKVLADNVGMPCRLVKGSQYTGVEDDAVNIIKLKNKREFLVDLMAAPGTLIPVDMPSWKENSFSAHDPNLHSKLPVLHANNVFGLNGSIPVSIDGNHKSEIKKPAVVSLPLASRRPNIQRIQHQLKNNDDSAVEKPDIFSSTVGNSMGHRNCDIIVPDSKQTVEDFKNLFVDLNPFGTALQSKIPVKNRRVDNMVDLQKQKDVLVLGRPPLPLKNRHACNEVPKNKENGGIIFKNSRKPNDCYFSALPSSSSSPALASSSSAEQDNVQRDIYKFDCASYNDGNASSALASDLIQLDDFPQEINLMGMENQLREIANKHVGAANESKGVNPSDPVINIKLKELEITSMAVDYGNNRVLDDVGDCEISWDDLVIGERIGLGSYGEVYHADWNGTEVAVKKFLDQDFSGAALEEFRREIRIMQRLRHPNIVLFMGAVTRPPNLSIVTEFLPRGSLYRILHRPHFLIDEKRRIRMALDVAKGMNCLHSSVPTIVHRDLKSPNLLVDKNWNVKVCDFGLSRLKHNTFLSSKSTAGTPEWMAPEVLRNEPSNEKCDVYSFGVILWELATLRFPWSGMNPMQVVGAVGFQNRHLEIPKDVHPLVSKIILECWQTDPNLRPSFAQLKVALKPLQQLVIPVMEEEAS